MWRKPLGHIIVATALVAGCTTGRHLPQMTQLQVREIQRKASIRAFRWTAAARSPGAIARTQTLTATP